MLIYSSILWLSLNIVTVCCDCSGGVSSLTAQYTTTGTITTENFRNAYPSNADCKWLLEAADPGQRVAIYFEEYLTEYDYDKLSVYDGNSEEANLLWSDSGDHTGRWVVSTGRYMYLWFTSDYSVQYIGFNIKYVSAGAEIQATSCPASVTTSSVPTQLSNVYVEYSCDLRVTNPTGKVRFSVLLGSNSGVTVYDGTSSTDTLIIEYYSSFENTNIYQSTGSDIYIVNPLWGKFILYHEAVDLSAPEPTVAVTQPAVTEHYEYSCSGNQLIATTSYGHILSPEHPNNYPNNVDCDTTITTQDPSSSIEFVILDIQLLYCCDYVEIFDGPDSTYNSWGIHWSVGDTQISTGSAIHIKFHSDSSGTLQGFQIDYREVPRALPTCLPPSYSSYNATTTEQFITSPFYPGEYEDNMLEYWLIIKPSETDSIVLNILDIDIEHSYACEYDRLTIYDGSCTDSPVIATLCGSEARVVEDSSGLYILIQFYTDYSVTNRGFELEFYIGEGEDDDPIDKSLLYIIGIAVGGLIVLVVIVCACCMYHKWRKASYVSPGTTTAYPATKTKPLEPKRLNIHQLYMELQSRSAKGHEKPARQKWKEITRNHIRNQAQPGPSGISTIGGYFSPHPPPQPCFDYPPPPYAGDRQYPAYPPNLFETAAKQALEAPTPALVPDSGLGQPTAPPVKLITKGSTPIPGPSTYMTPADARKAGLYA